MKTPAPSLAAGGLAEPSSISCWLELVKARLTFLVLLTTLVGFYMGSGREVDWLLLLHTLAGTALVACGAAALNQLWERDHDARMRRTQDRPLPAGRIQPRSALAFGIAASAGGLAWLAWGAGLLSALTAGLTLSSYLLVYTPLKRRTALNTWVGAVPGALPPVIGWVAARGEFSLGGVALFSILFCWQIPHFLAIAWLYREDYARAGFRMLPAVDDAGPLTARLSLAFLVLLLVAAQLPHLAGNTTGLYLAGASLASLAYAWTGWAFWRQSCARTARLLFLASILYLPAVLALLMMAKAA